MTKWDASLKCKVGSTYDPAIPPWVHIQKNYKNRNVNSYLYTNDNSIIHNNQNSNVQLQAKEC